MMVSSRTRLRCRSLSVLMAHRSLPHLVPHTGSGESAVACGAAVGGAASEDAASEEAAFEDAASERVAVSAELDWRQATAKQASASQSAVMRNGRCIHMFPNVVAARAGQ